jgi:hypothetical protein
VVLGAMVRGQRRWCEGRWTDNAPMPAARDRWQYGYDRDSNRLYKENLVNSARSEVYAYDGLNQITNMQRGDRPGRPLRSCRTTRRGAARGRAVAGGRRGGGLPGGRRRPGVGVDADVGRAVHVHLHPRGGDDQ